MNKEEIIEMIKENLRVEVVQREVCGDEQVTVELYWGLYLLSSESVYV